MVKYSAKSIEDRIAGAIFGLAVGDAMGARTEGMNPEQIRKIFGYIDGPAQGSGTGTDDTEFTLYYTQLLGRYGRNISSEDVANGWLEDIYHPDENYKGAGFSETLTLRNLRNGIRPPASGRHVHSWSDGLAMCAAPFGCVYPGNPRKAAELCSVFGAVSHSREGIYGGRAVAAAVASALSGASPAEIISSALEAVPADSWCSANIRHAMDLSSGTDGSTGTTDELYRNLVNHSYFWSDLAPEAVSAAFGLVTANDWDFKASVLEAVNFGRDADTIAALCGSLCGSFHGMSVIPPEWLEGIDNVPGSCIRSLSGRTLSSGIEILIQMNRIGEDRS